jgi:hypothetical protein
MTRLVLNLHTAYSDVGGTDANINLLELENQNPQNYMNLLFAAGYLQGILKATRIQNASRSLIDHIHFNNISNDILSGVIISDISDHLSVLGQTFPETKFIKRLSHVISRSKTF